MSNPDPAWYPNGIGDALYAIVWSMYGWGDAFVYITSRYSDGYPSAWTVLDPAPMTVDVDSGRRMYRSGQNRLNPEQHGADHAQPHRGRARNVSDQGVRGVHQRTSRRCRPRTGDDGERRHAELRAQVEAQAELRAGDCASGSVDGEGRWAKGCSCRPAARHRVRAVGVLTRRHDAPGQPRPSTPRSWQVPTASRRRW